MSSPILVAYYSHSGNTEHLAKAIAARTGGDLYAITPVSPYPAAYQRVLEQARSEVKSGFLPPLAGLPVNPEAYHTIFIGSPNWFDTIAPPVASFLQTLSLSGKTVIPFCTHGGGGARPLKEMKKLCPNASFLPGFAVYGSGSGALESELSAWLERIGL